MTALSADTERNKRAVHKMVQDEIGAAANAVWYQGSIIMNNASGYGIVGADTASCTALGVATNSGDNTGGSAGDLTIKYAYGHQEQFAISGSEIAIADIGKTCVIVDDNTVGDAAAQTNDVQLGIVRAIESSKAWVEVAVMNNSAA